MRRKYSKLVFCCIEGSCHINVDGQNSKINVTACEHCQLTAFWCGQIFYPQVSSCLVRNPTLKLTARKIYSFDDSSTDCAGNQWTVAERWWKREKNSEAREKDTRVPKLAGTK